MNVFMNEEGYMNMNLDLMVAFMLLYIMRENLLYFSLLEN